MVQVFDNIVDAYDRWYDTREGAAVFRAELECLRSLHRKHSGRWLEIGVGTGRFAHSLNIAEGIDPSVEMLKVAAGRGVRTKAGTAEHIPFAEGTLDGILMALTLCFVADISSALQECRRVLRENGCLLLGVIPADRQWGQTYRKKADSGHPVYAAAHFRTITEVAGLVQDAGFALTSAESTLFWSPGENPQTEPRIESGICPEAGFIALFFQKSDPDNPISLRTTRYLTS